MPGDIVLLRSNTGNPIYLTKNQDTKLYDTKTQCISCHKSVEFQLQPSGVLLHQLGALTQEAFPALDAGLRELFISGICNDCFDNMFKE